MNTIVRTAVAVLCGFLAITLVVISGTVVLASTLVPEGMGALSGSGAIPLPGPYLAANLVLSLLAAVFGGWLASRLDTPSGWRPVVALALLVLVMSIANQAVPRASSGAPVPWYPWALIVLGVAGAIWGGWLRLRTHTRRAPSEVASTSDTAQSYS